MGGGRTVRTLVPHRGTAPGAGTGPKWVRNGPKWSNNPQYDSLFLIFHDFHEKHGNSSLFTTFRSSNGRIGLTSSALTGQRLVLEMNGIF